MVMALCRDYCDARVLQGLGDFQAGKGARQTVSLVFGEANIGNIKKIGGFDSPRKR